MTTPQQAEVKARNTGKVYVLGRAFMAGRDFIPFHPNAAAGILRRLDETHHFTDLDARAFLDKHEDPEKVRAWCKAAWEGTYPPRPGNSDTWERVFPVLKARGLHGATGAEIARLTGLGHGAVSAALSVWAEAECAFRLRDRPS